RVDRGGVRVLRPGRDPGTRARSHQRLGTGRRPRNRGSPRGGGLLGDLRPAGAVILIEAALLVVLLRRHGKVRFVLLAMLFVHGVVTLIADAFLAAPGDQELGIRVLLVLQLALAGAAVIASVLHGASQWFRAEGQARGRPTG